MSTTKRIAKNFIWLLGGNIASGGLLFLIYVFLARVLGVWAFGLLSFAQAVTSYLVLLVDSGLSLFGMNKIAANKSIAGHLALNIFAVRLSIALLLYLASALLVTFLPIAANMKLLFLLAFIFIFYRALNADWVFQGLEQMEFITVGKLAYTLLAGGLALLLVKGPADLLGAVAIISLAGVLVSGLMLIFLFRRVLTVDFGWLAPAQWANYFLLALPLGASLAMIQVCNNLDTVMLGFMDRPEMVGYYNAAYKIFFIGLGIFCTWLSTAMPVASARFQTDQEAAHRFLQKFLRLTLILIVPLVLLTFLAAPLIIRLFFGSQYDQAVLGLRILCWALLPMSLGSTYGVLILIPSGHYNLFLYSSLAGATVNLVFNLLLIPAFSFYGAASATLLAELAALAVVYRFSRSVMTLEFLPAVGKPLVYTLLAGLAWFLARSWLTVHHWLVSQSLAGLAFVSVYLAMLFVWDKTFILGFAKELKSK
ncbi:MAG: oligosaccharide flippase family protein [Candidatus Saganbacteria bacterium]|nr:oligosaccharide flippase family protein [Candidatus Saganbacteria bacterium]